MLLQRRERGVGDPANPKTTRSQPNLSPRDCPFPTIDRLFVLLESNQSRAVPMHPLLTRAVSLKGSPGADMLGGHLLLCFMWTILIAAISAVNNKITAAKLFCGE